MEESTRPSVLVAEDDAQLNRLVVTWLKRADLDVDSVTDGAEAIEAIKKKNYSVILLDMMMPRVTGFDVIEYAARHQPKLLDNIIVMTAAGESVSERIKGHAVYRLISKPFDLRELLDCALECARTRSEAQVSFNREEDGVAGGRALIVDSDETSRRALALPLDGKFEIDYADDAFTAIEALKRHDYDVILLDLALPGIDGLGVIRYLEEHQPHILDRVVLVTIAPGAVNDMRVGAVIPRPESEEELSSYINAHLVRLGGRADSDTSRQRSNRPRPNGST